MHFLCANDLLKKVVENIITTTITREKMTLIARSNNWIAFAKISYRCIPIISRLSN